MTIDKSIVDTIAEKHNCPVWISADEELIPLVLMNERRLRNCLNHVRQRIKAECVSLYSCPPPSGEMAQELYYSDDNDEDETYRLRIFLRRWESRLMDEMMRRELKEGQ